MKETFKEPKPNFMVRAGIIVITTLLAAVIVAAFVLFVWNAYDQLCHG